LLLETADAPIIPQTMLRNSLHDAGVSLAKVIILDIVRIIVEWPPSKMVMIDLANPMFADEVKVREWLEAGIWQDGPICPACGVVNGFALMRCKLYRTGRRRSGRNAVAPTPLRPTRQQVDGHLLIFKRGCKALLAEKELAS
jgi:hypothetical protein